MTILRRRHPQPRPLMSQLSQPTCHPSRLSWCKSLPLSAHQRLRAQAPAPDNHVEVDVQAQDVVEPPSAVEAFKVGQLCFQLPSPSTDAMTSVLSLRHSYSETGKLNQFRKPGSICQYPDKRFIPEPEGFFDRIKSPDTRDGWEAQFLWNTGHKKEHSI